MPLAELVLSAILGPVVTDLYGRGADGVRGLLEKDPLRRPLRRALEQAEQGFYQYLQAIGFDLGPQAKADLDEIFRDAAFVRAVAELPFRPIGAIDTAHCRELFEQMGPGDADGDDFDAAWQAMGRRFSKAATQAPELARLLEISRLEASAEQQRLSAEQLGALLAEVEKIREQLETGGRDLDGELAGYRTWFYDHYRYVDTRGLFMREKERPGEGIELRQVFVETRLAPVERREKAERDREEEEEAPRGLRSELEEELGLVRGLGLGAGPGRETLPIGELLGREARDAAPGKPLVLLGAPGSGKSTLMRCLGMAVCDEQARPELLDPGPAVDLVPVLLPLRSFASELSSKPNRKLLPFLVEELADKLPGLEDLLKDGRVLVLLDGLDEIFDERHRRWVSDQTWELITQFPQSRFILTSRPHGYAAAPLPGPVDLWQLEPFDEDGIRQFFRGWFSALLREGVDPGAAGDPTAKADALTEEVLARPRIREMAQNPMLCTLIVLVHRARAGHLPQRRTEFFEAAVWTLAERWEQAKRHPEQKGEGEFPEPEIVVKALEEVAWKAFHELEQREIPEAVLRGWLEGVLADYPEWTGRRGRRAVTAFLKVVRERTGLLVEAGGEKYQFVHLSLHEYLAAQYILDRLDEAGSTEVLLHYLHAPEGEEVLRLVVASAGQARAQKLLRSVLTRDRDQIGVEIESRLHRDLRFAGRCLGDGVVVSPELRSEIRKRLGDAVESGHSMQLGALTKDCLAVGITVELAISLLRQGIGGAWPSHLIEDAATDSAVRAAAWERLADDDPRVRWSAVGFFARIGSGDEKVRRTLAERLDDDDPHVRRTAADIFWLIGSDDEMVRQALVERLADDDREVRRSAARFLAGSGSDDEEVQRALAERLYDDDSEVRWTALEYFARFRSEDEEVRSAFTERLDGDNSEVRRSAAEFFAWIGSDDEEARRALAERLADDDRRVRWSAVEFFAQHGSDDEGVRRAVAERLSDDDHRIRWSAVEFFARIGSDDEEVRWAVAERLDDDDPGVRSNAVAFFAQVGTVSESVRRRLISLLEDPEPSVRAAALGFLATQRLPAISLSKLLDIFSQVADDTRPDLGWRVAKIAGRLAAGEPGSFALLLERGAAIERFSLAAALETYAVERDRIRREVTPLDVSPA